MKVCFFDDARGGHHEGYLAGIVRAATQHGIYPLVATPKRPATLDESKGKWLQVPNVGLREIRAGRESLRSVVKASLAEDIAVFLNLFLDKTIWAVPAELGRLSRRTHVLHHTSQYSYEGRRGIARLRTFAARRKLTGWARRGDIVVVHTAHADAVMSTFLPHESLVVLGYPTRRPPPAENRPTSNSEHDAGELLFVGQARREKGLSHLLDALRWLPDDVSVKVVGPQNRVVRTELESLSENSRVRWVDEYVSDSKLAHHFAQASLVVLPYETSFGRDGGASGVLLESLAHGVPLVTTKALEAQLPVAYGGAIVVEPENPRALAEGITRALANLPAVGAAARSTGPGFILENHTFDAYVRGLVAE